MQRKKLTRCKNWIQQQNMAICNVTRQLLIDQLYHIHTQHSKKLFCTIFWILLFLKRKKILTAFVIAQKRKILRTIIHPNISPIYCTTFPSDTKEGKIQIYTAVGIKPSSQQTATCLPLSPSRCIKIFPILIPLQHARSAFSILSPLLRTTTQVKYFSFTGPKHPENPHTF